MAVLSLFWAKKHHGPLGINALAFEIFVAWDNLTNLYFRALYDMFLGLDFCTKSRVHDINNLLNQSIKN